MLGLIGRLRVSIYAAYSTDLILSHNVSANQIENTNQL